ncbi:MAG: TetR/AcrR family transcriptional regulator [Tagaea sp.]|nr:TetR/AcrR family transcriptional regulator [Tagaea sp.]
MTRYKEGHRERTREEIVDAASRLMRDRGYDAATIGAVMQAAGLTHGGFYAHFPDKTALLAAATQAAFVRSPKNFAFLAEKARDTGDAGVVAKGYLAEGRVADLAGGCPAAALMSQTPRQDETIRAAFQEGAEATVRALARAPGLSAEDGDLAWAALAMLVGGLGLMRAVPDLALAARIREQIVVALRKLTAAPHTHEKDTR